MGPHSAPAEPGVAAQARRPSDPVIVQAGIAMRVLFFVDGAARIGMPIGRRGSRRPIAARRTEARRRPASGAFSAR